ncbi:MAG: DUF47 family protein [Elusimicrobia bacterium]|nr:DUF47 family protein [Elusimicrobiota bacterium]
MKLFKFFKREKPDFYSMLEKHSSIVYEGNKLLRIYVDGNAEDNSLAEKINLLEREADDARRVLIENLNKTLITPMDREDLFALSREVDNLIDYANIAVEEINLFNVKPTPELCMMAKILERGSLELYDSIKNLKDLPSIAKERALKTKTTQKHMHHTYLEALANLFNGKYETSYMLKMREVYRHLNRAANRCDEAANLILDILIKF